MADVTIKYKGSTIAEMSDTGSKILKTSGTYCEGDIAVEYAPNTKSYEITLAKVAGWVLLTTLDDEVIEHINDENLFVSMVKISDYTYSWYTGIMHFVGNRIIGYYGSAKRTVYGASNRETSETNCTFHLIFTPANSTSSSIVSGAYGQFRITDGKYYFCAGDGYIGDGTYKLTFTW